MSNNCWNKIFKIQPLKGQKRPLRTSHQPFLVIAAVFAGTIEEEKRNGFSFFHRGATKGNDSPMNNDLGMFHKPF